MFKFGHIELLWLLPLPILIRWLLPEASHQKTRALLFPFFQRLTEVSKKSDWNFASRRWRALLMTLIWILLVGGSANPEWLGSPIELPRSGRDIILAIDISASMGTPDMQINGRVTDRTTLVKTVAKQFIENRIGDRIGLILFASRAYLQTPLTFDRHTVSERIDDASIGLAGQQTAIGDAIGLAIKRFEKSSDKNRVLVLLTDGENNTGLLQPLQAADIAAKNHIKIYTIGLGSDRIVVNGLFGPQVIQNPQEIDEASLKQIAQMTGGVFFRSTDRDSLLKAYKTISELEPTEQQANVFYPKKALYPWPLSAALLLSVLLALTHRRGKMV